MSHVRSIPSQVTHLPWVWAKRNTRATRSEVHDPSKVGKWMLFLDIKKRNSNGLTELDRAWFSLTTLVTEKILHGAKCSTAMSDTNKDTGVIVCYTADYSDKIKVREAAEAIHRIVKLKSPMYYKTDETTHAGIYSHLGHKNVSIYRFCPDLTLCERNPHTSSWIEIENEMPSGEGTPVESLIPSKVTWSRWLWAGPEIHPSMDDAEVIKTGKWLLFLDQEDEDKNGLTQLDKAWPSVVRLVNEGILISAKCCTAVTPSYNDPTKGVIACYTSDYTDKAKIKEAADAIHSSFREQGTMYYKTDEATRERDTVSMYKYCSDRKLYERDEESEWRLVE